MADDLSLLLRIKGDASGAKQAASESRTAIAQLRSQVASDSKTIAAAGQAGAKGTQSLALSLQTVQTSLQSIGGPVGAFSGQIGNASSLLSVLSTDAASTGGALAGMAGPIGIAVAAFAALATGVITLSKQFIDLTISTAQWEGKLYDLSQQTGVSVETLSTLSALAEDTGGSIESVAQSLVIFQGQLEEAQDSTSKAGKQFADLGISTNNTEQALRDAIKALAAMDDTFHQTNAAAELFGRRGGKQLLAILKESHGDIDATTEKLRALNSLVTTDVARGADQLNDQLNATRRQFQGLTAQIVNESMPLIVKALQDLSRILRENRETFILLGQAIGFFLQGNLRLIAPAVEIATLAFQGHRRAILPLIEAYERLAAAMQIVSGSIPNIDPNAIPAVKTPTVFNPGATAGAVSQILGATNRPKGSGGGRVAARDTALQDAIKEAELTEQEILQRLATDIRENKNALETQVRDIEEFTRRAIDLSDEQGRAAIDRINAEYIALQDSLRKKLISEEEFNRRKRQIDIDTAAAIEKNNAEIADLEDARDKKLAAADLATHAGSVQIADEASDRIIASIKDRVERQLLSEAEGERQIAGLLAQGYERRKKLLEDELDNYGVTLERREAINVALILLDGERAQAAVDASQRIVDALKKEREEFEKRNREAFGVERPRRVGDATRPRQVEPRDRSAIDQLFEAANENLSGASQTAALAGLEALTGAFQGLGQAIGQVVEAWVLYGSAGTSVRKVTAQILAGVAAQAAVKAVFELAEGFAALALAFFGLPNAGPSASAHFTAAAIYGSIAGIAAIAGRAVAGDAFKQTGDSGSGGGARGSGSRTTSQTVNPIDLARTRQREELHIFVHAEPGARFNDAVVNALITDVQRNGSSRDVIIHTAGG